MVKKKQLPLKQKKFCELYASDKELFGNGVYSYIKAYDLDTESRKDYESARRNASRLLTNVDICNYINTLLDSQGLNDENVDKQLLFLINQHGDLTNKRGAISEYNKLRQRIIEKQEINLTGLPFNSEYSFNGSK